MSIVENWILLALLGPLFWTLSDFIDKYVIDNHTTSIVDFLFSFSLTSWFCLALLVCLFGVPTLSTEGFIAILLGFFTTVSFYFYALGLQYMDTSLAILTFKLVPIFAIFLSFIMFSEPVYIKEILASIIVVVGGLYLFLKLDRGKFTCNRGLPWMLLAVGMWSIIFVVANHLLNTMSFRQYMVFDTFGAAFVSIPMLLIPKTLRAIRVGIKSSSPQKYGWFFLNTFSDFLAQVCLKKSFSLAPTVGAVSLVTQVQSVYGIFAGIALTLLMPSIFKEDISRENIAKKLIGSSVIACGIYIALI